MSFEVNKDTIKIYKQINPLKVKSIVDSDIIVPDSKPDVSEILQVNAIASVDEKYVQKDFITVSGYLDYIILYTGSENENTIKCIKHKTPYTQQIDAPGINDEMTNYVIADVSHIEFGIKNSRKINIKSVVVFDTGVIGTTSVNAVSSVVSTVNIPNKTEDIDVLNISVFEQTDFSLEQDIKISVDSGDETEILKVDYKISDEEIKTVNNKVIAKGTMDVDVLYSVNDDLCHVQSEIPFTEVFDADNITPQMHTEIQYNLTSVDYDLTVNEDDEYFISLNAKTEVLIRGYDVNSYNVISDIYSPDYKMEYNYEDCSVLCIKDTFSKDYAITEKISISESPFSISKVCNLNVKPNIETIVPYNSYCLTEGFFDIKLLYISDNETLKLCSHNEKIPFSIKTDSKSIHSDSVLDVKLSMIHSGYVLNSEKDIDIRINLHGSYKVLCEDKKRILSDISLYEDEILKKENQSGITIYFADDKEKLWDVAKRFSTTVEEIAEVNNLDADAVLTSRQQLLIPKRIAL